MEEKIFKLIESMYGEMKQGFTNLENKIEDNRKAIVGLENRLGGKIDALFDGYKQNTEAINRLETKFDALSEKVDKQEVEIRVIKGAK